MEAVDAGDFVFEKVRLLNRLRTLAARVRPGDDVCEEIVISVLRTAEKDLADLVRRIEDGEV